MRVLIIPAAGEGKRFRAVGVKVAKPFIVVNGATMLERAMEPFQDWAEKIIVVLRSEDEDNFQDLWDDKEVPVEPVYIDHPQSGPALSVLCAQGLVADDDEVLVVDCDITMREVPEEWWDTIDGRCHGAVLTHIVNPGGAYSYVLRKSRHPTEVYEIQEKSVISNEACCGVYYFKEWAFFRRLLGWFLHQGHTVNGEYFVAPLLYRMSVEGQMVKAVTVKPENGFYALGTPELVKKFEERKP